MHTNTRKMGERSQPYCMLSPQNLYNPGYDPTGDDPAKYEQQLPHPATQPAPGQYASGQYTPVNKYPLLQQLAVPAQLRVPNTPVVLRRDLTWNAVWVSVCCFWNIGLCALYYAIRAENNYVTGDFAKSEDYRRRSVLLIRIAVFIGSFVVISVIIAVIVMASLTWSAN